MRTARKNSKYTDRTSTYLQEGPKVQRYDLSLIGMPVGSYKIFRNLRLWIYVDCHGREVRINPLGMYFRSYLLLHNELPR